MNVIQGPYSQSRNFAGLNPELSDYSGSRVVILPIPYDATSEWHGGSRAGPYSIIDASTYLEFYDIEIDTDISSVGIHTLPAIQPSLNSPLETVNIIKTQISKLLKDNKFIVALGGEHSITTGIVNAFKDHFASISVLQLDAHADLRDEYTGTKYSHASVMRRVVDLCSITQVGVRSMSAEERPLANSERIRTFFYEEGGIDDFTIEQVTNSLSDRVYVTIDLDAFDPSIMSAVGTPEPGGIKWQEALHLLRAVAAQKKIVGFDVVELCPSQGPASCAFMAAKLAYKLIGYSLIMHP